MFPLVREYLLANASGINPDVVFRNSLYTSQFLLGFALLMLIGVFVAAATGVLFAAKKKVTLWSVLGSTAVSYISVLYTSILAGLVVILSLVPAFALNIWYINFARGEAVVYGNATLAVDVIVLIAVIALLIPAAIVTTWVMYAPLAVALKAAPAGFTAIMHTKHLVRHHVWQLIWRIVGSMALFKIVSESVAGLPHASYIVPFVLSIIIMAFFVEIYKELQEA